MSYKRVYSTFRPDDLGLIKSLLIESGVNFYVANEYAAGVYPLGLCMDIMVEEEQVEEAEKIIEDYKDKTK